MIANLSGRMPIVILSALIGALMLLAACGGGDDDDDAAGDGGGGEATVTEAAGDDAGEGEAPPVDVGGEPTDAGGDDDDGGGSEGDDGPDVCALLTEEEIQDATGAAFPAGTNSDFPPFYSCAWMNDNLDSVDVSLISRDEGADALFDLNPGVDTEDVDGLGDRAHWLKGALPMLEVLDGDWYVSIDINISDFDEEQQKQASIQLAEAVLDRLP